MGGVGQRLVAADRRRSAASDCKKGNNRLVVATIIEIGLSMVADARNITTRRAAGDSLIASERATTRRPTGRVAVVDDWPAAVRRLIS